MPASETWQFRRFCVVVPMYNEENGARMCVEQVCGRLNEIPYPSKLLVVNDGSRDRTGEILSKLKSRFSNLVVIDQEKNVGYGAALRTGIRHAAAMEFDYVLFMDSDLTNNPADIAKFVACMERGIDVIKASRFVAGGSMRGVPWKRSFFSRTGNIVARVLFHVGLRDCTNGFRALKVSVLSRMRLRESGFPIIVEELYQAKSIARTFCEVPVVLTNRASDQRPTSFSYKPETFRKYLGFGLRAFFGVKPDLQQEPVR